VTVTVRARGAAFHSTCLVYILISKQWVVTYYYIITSVVLQNYCPAT
jgi:hypothetical protein